MPYLLKHMNREITEQLIDICADTNKDIEKAHVTSFQIGMHIMI